MLDWIQIAFSYTIKCSNLIHSSHRVLYVNWFYTVSLGMSLIKTWNEASEREEGGIIDDPPNIYI